MGKKIEKQLGKRVAKLRAAAGLTQAGLAEDVGVATETISRLERGVTIPSVSRLDDVARALGGGISDLFEPNPSTIARNKALGDLITELRKRTPRDIELVRDLARRVFAYATERRR